MKKILLFSLLLSALIGCKEQDFPYIGSIVFDEYEIILDKDAKTHVIPAKSDLGEVSVIISPDTVDWCEATFVEEGLKVTVTHNPESMRTAVVKMKGGYYETSVELLQMGEKANYFELNNKGWTATCSDEQVNDGGGVSTIFDDDADTYWHSAWSPPANLPHWIEVDMQEVKSINKVRLGWRVNNGSFYAHTKTTNVSVSADGETFKQVGTIINTHTGASPNNPEYHELAFEGDEDARYIRLDMIESNNGQICNLRYLKVYTNEYKKD